MASRFVISFIMHVPGAQYIDEAPSYALVEMFPR
uniref:Transposase n=1 Tax=Echinococcus granulosus TaxID=6210 RepID=A0A068WK99_ECHGR|nr:hypothetical protein EgrG_001122300 [Echinococcus granulosus]